MFDDLNLSAFWYSRQCQRIEQAQIHSTGIQGEEIRGLFMRLAHGLQQLALRLLSTIMSNASFLNLASWLLTSFVLVFSNYNLLVVHEYRFPLNLVTYQWLTIMLVTQLSSMAAKLMSKEERDVELTLVLKYFLPLGILSAFRSLCIYVQPTTVSFCVGTFVYEINVL